MNGTQLYKVRSGPYDGDNSHSSVQNLQLYISSEDGAHVDTMKDFITDRQHRLGLLNI